MEWLEYRIYRNPLSDWLVALAVVVVVLVLIGAVRRLLKRRFRGAEKTPTDLDDLLLDLVVRTKLPLIAIVTAYGSITHLQIEPIVLRTMRGAAIFAALFQVGFWGIGFIDYFIARYRRKRFETDPAAVTTIAAFGFFGKIAIWIFLLLIALDNNGFEITTLIAGLGVGGIAIALATQNILGDLFASLSIVVDKPFVLGDFIIVGSEMGTVERIGLKTTRVRSLSGEQLVFSNSDLLQSRVRNYKRMIERRAVFRFGVLYDTTREQLERIPGIVEEIVRQTPDTRFDRAHFQKFGDSSLDFEVVYWMLVPDYNRYMDAQQRINLELFSRLREIGVGFAFPTRTLHVESWPDAGTGGAPALR
ncbi:MAG TPA: mechanosensitive ion channel family protein [Thermoanaerobaculia bacterium]|nr:mechanosensitive ion channel family protein [Thermoanaerobaculia bacterium]